jgi:hypothetical protein
MQQNSLGLPDVLDSQTANESASTLLPPTPSRRGQGNLDDLFFYLPRAETVL